MLQLPSSAEAQLEKVTRKINCRKNITLYTKGANPLTGLPGNGFIQREIGKMLSKSVHFDICSIDIDFFKPYNDKHGYTRGGYGNIHTPRRNNSMFFKEEELFFAVNKA